MVTDIPEKHSRWRWLLALPAGVAGVLGVGAQVGPDDTTKHLRDWATFLGLSWPVGLSAGRFFAGVVVVLLLFYAIVYRVPLRRAIRAFRDLPPTNELEAKVKGLEEAAKNHSGEMHLAAVKEVNASEAHRREIENLNRQVEVLRRQLEDMTTRELRVLWNLKGLATVNRALALIETALEKTSGANTEFRPLIKEKIQALERTRDTLCGSLTDDTVVPLDKIREQFGIVGGGYNGVLHWVAVLRDRAAADFSDERLDAQLRNWKSTHNGFMAEVVRLGETPEHRATLAVWPNRVADTRLFALLREAFPDG